MAETKMQLVDWLDDLCVRFIVNLPQEELESVARICFQVEEAQWFYEDFIRPTDPSLPSLNLRDFCLRIFQHCPLLSTFSDSQHTAAYQEFLAYKTRVPVRGAILLNHDMDQVVLVKGWKKGATWSFPRGKINKDEKDLDCAIREVWEETGYDVADAGLAHDEQKYIDVTMREQHLRMFVFRGVPLDTYFEPKTRKEISKITWYRLADLPSYNQKRSNRHHQDAGGDQGAVSANKLYMVAPFLPPLKKWINQQRKRDAARQAQVDSLAEEPLLSETPGPEAEPHSQSSTDPAVELKRLLSVNAPLQGVAQTAANEDANQANALLAMLRGGPSTGGLAPPANSGLPPATPLDQVTTTPPEPGTPHYHHAKPSPAVKQQPPPAFPFPSPAHAHAHHRNSSLHPPGQLGIDAHDNLQRALPQGSQLPHEPIHAPAHMHPQVHQPSIQVQNMQHHQFLPQGHQAPLAHGPVAPAPSQLPPPRLNNHAMNLLHAFKSPSLSQRPPVSNIQSGPHGQGMMGFPNQGQSLGQIQGYAQPSQLGGMVQQQAPPRSAHQNSLLDMFRSPNAVNAVPVSQTPPVPAQAPYVPEQQPQPSESVPTVGAPKQRSTTLAMMTRTLPRAKATPSPSPAPSTPGGDMFPAKQAVRQAQMAHTRSSSATQSKASAPDAPRAAVSILPRPGSAARTSPMSPKPDTVSTPAKLRRGHKNEQPNNFTILQRPSPRADQNGSPELAESRQSVAKQAQEAPKQFQPQILQRPKAESPGVSQGQEQAPPNSNDQRSALLALFAKQNPGMVQAESRSGSAMSSNSAAPLPLDPAAFRSRLASTSSALSNAGEHDGLKSPSTPVEAKGFLLDYLNGVVKNEKQKGPKRGQY